MVHSVEEFAKSFGVEVSEMPYEAVKIIESSNFEYRILGGGERDKAILDSLKRMDADKQRIAAPERTDVWERGWNENLTDFRNSNYDLNMLIPKFYRKNIPLRLNQQFIKSDNEKFEYDFLRVFRVWLFKTYFSDADNIYEFGSGTGHNLIELAELYPDKTLFGLDFVPSAVELLEDIKVKKEKNITGVLFNMIEPDMDLKVLDNSAFFTMGAIEQLGSKIDKLISFFLDKKPKIIAHMEPTVELYDDSILIDYLAKKFHKQRGYTEGLLPKIKELEKQGMAEIVKVKRLYFGNDSMEGYTLIVWKPFRK